MQKRSVVQRVIKWVGSPRFIWVIVGILAVQAAWIALSGRYPMAFDEDFHFGLIKLYAHHISPFWDAHPAGGDAFGALTRDPSYLYHWLMSFPYRLLSVFTNTEASIVLVLRFLNIALFASCIPLFRRLLMKTGASRTLVHFALLLFVLVPIAPLLAAQINYDNLILPVTAATLLLALRFKERTTAKAFDAWSLLWLLVVGLLSCLVKYPFLPVFVAAVLFVLVHGWRTYGGVAVLRKALPPLGGWKLIAMSLLLVVSLGLFAERYAVNVAKYHAPVADCSQVLSYDHCRNYGPWIRDYNFEHTKAGVNTNPLLYTRHWFYGMWLSSFFAVDGPASNYATRGPLIIPGVAGAVLAIMGALAVLLAARRLWRRYDAPLLWLWSLATVFYVAALWITEYQLYRQTGQPVAINGRYLLPFLPFLILLGSLAVKELLAKRQRLQVAIASLAVLALLWGGGAFTYILRSDDSWYWNNGAVRQANHAVQHVLGPVSPGYHNPLQFFKP